MADEPKLRDLWGSVPNLTGGLSAEEYVAKMRQECDRCGQPYSRHGGVERFCPFYSTFRAKADPSTPSRERAP